MSDLRLQIDLLLQAGRLLLEYNESTEAIRRALMATARALTDAHCEVRVTYRGLAVSIAREGPAMEPVKELRYNMAVLARVHAILERVRRGELAVSAALGMLKSVEADTPRHSRWVAALVLGASAASLALLLGADPVGSAVAGLATTLGLLARQELGRRHFSLLALPLTASLIGAVLGGLAIRWGWTRSVELVLIVPALMVVPGPHLINGLLDLIDNHLPMSLARFGLAAGILLASALGTIVGIELTDPGAFQPGQGAETDRLNLVSDVALAAIVACGFAMFYNTSWWQLCMAALGGMAGHGLRFLALEAGCTLQAATFLGGLTVGLISGWLARSSRTPVAVIGFAGAVTMIPGLSLYRALGGALRLARLPDSADWNTAAGTLGYAFQGGLVVGGLALGLILGAQAVLALTRTIDAPRGSGNDRHAEEASHLVTARLDAPVSTSRRTTEYAWREKP
jgi:uncharacterized membrane protein YjjP (DUF1212 family)